jgi:hypothetical protein
MTEEEKRAQMAARDAEICALYLTGASLAECGKKYGLKRQRIKQIVQKAGVWREYVRPPTNGRDEFLGVNISEEDKLALRDEAKRRGISMSALTADLIKDMLAELPRHEPSIASEPAQESE